MISSLVNNSDTTGIHKLTIAKSNKRILALDMDTSILETDLGWLLLLSLINAISPLLQLNIYNSVVIQLAQQEQEKHRQLKISPKLWLYSVQSSTVQMVLTTELWVDFSVAWLKEALGLASISSIESILKFSVSLLNKFSLSNKLSKEMMLNSSSKLELFLSAVDLVSLSL